MGQLDCKSCGMVNSTIGDKNQNKNLVPIEPIEVKSY